MLPIFLLSLYYLQSCSAFRGPHHPQSSVSHHHYTPQADVKLTQDSQLLHDTAHLAEDMNTLGDHLDLSKMTAEEIDFYYFKSHDMDNNTKLDGLEILHAIQHTFHDNNQDTDPNDTNTIPLIVELIDRVLEEDDLDNDGYLGYIEYVLARQRSEDDDDVHKARNLKLEIK